MPGGMDEPQRSGLWETQPLEDVTGQDRLARSVLRLVARMDPATVVAVHGAPGSGKVDFVQRMAWLVSAPRRGEPIPGLLPLVVWYDPWAWSHQGHIVGGLIAAVARAQAQIAPLQEQARDLMARVARLRFDGQHGDPDQQVAALDADLVEQLAEGFAQLVRGVRGGRLERLLVFVGEMDQLNPAQRWQMLAGIRLLLRHRADVTVVMAVGRESMLSSLRHREGEMSATSATRELDDIFDLTITVPGLEVRRIGTLLREYVGPSEPLVKRSFGEEALQGLSSAAAHRPLGSPRFLKRLAWRVILLAEYAQEIKAARNLSEAQWAWVIISERWPDFRRFMIRGGRERWLELKHAVSRLSQRGDPRASTTGGSSILKWLEEDLILADYLRLHAEGFEKDAEGIFWLENMLLTAGL